MRQANIGGVGARVRDTLHVQPAEGKGEAHVRHPGGVRGTGFRASTLRGCGTFLLDISMTNGTSA